MNLWEHFLQSFAFNLRATLHVEVIRGRDRHHIVEAALQLRGEADDTGVNNGGNRQVPDAKFAISNGSGGILAATSALVMSSEPPSAS